LSYINRLTVKFAISDAALNNLVRRVLDEVSEHNINDSAHLLKFKNYKIPYSLFHRYDHQGGNCLRDSFPLMILTMKQAAGDLKVFKLLKVC